MCFNQMLFIPTPIIYKKKIPYTYVLQTLKKRIFCSTLPGVSSYESLTNTLLFTGENLTELSFSNGD